MSKVSGQKSSTRSSNSAKTQASPANADIDQLGGRTEETENASKAVKKKSLRPSEDSLWDIQAELESYSYLLRWNDSGDGVSEALYGLGLALRNLSQRLASVAGSLGPYGR